MSPINGRGRRRNTKEVRAAPRGLLTGKRHPHSDHEAETAQRAGKMPGSVEGPVQLDILPPFAAAITHESGPTGPLHVMLSSVAAPGRSLSPYLDMLGSNTVIVLNSLDN